MMTCSGFDNILYSANSWLVVDDIHFTGTSLNIPNQDFEAWHNEESVKLANWNYSGREFTPVDTIGWIAARSTTDAVSNKYAVRLKTTCFQNGTIAGNLNSGNNKTEKFPVSMRHQMLTGYYKFFPQNNDTMTAHIKMYRNGNIVGAGNFTQINTISTYTPFTIDISYFSPDDPDSAIIDFMCFKNYPFGNSELYLDILNFDGFLDIGVLMSSPYTAPISEETYFIVYPNPFSDQATVSFSVNKDEDVLVRLFDLSGKQISVLADGHFTQGEHKIDLSAAGLGKGFYICVINTGDASLSKKIILY
jgi:hypothetical protein